MTAERPLYRVMAPRRDGGDANYTIHAVRSWYNDCFMSFSDLDRPFGRGFLINRKKQKRGKVAFLPLASFS